MGYKYVLSSDIDYSSRTVFCHIFLRFILILSSALPLSRLLPITAPWSRDRSARRLRTPAAPSSWPFKANSGQGVRQCTATTPKCSKPPNQRKAAAKATTTSTSCRWWSKPTRKRPTRSGKPRRSRRFGTRRLRTRWQWEAWGPSRRTTATATWRSLRWCKCVCCSVMLLNWLDREHASAIENINKTKERV